MSYAITDITDKLKATREARGLSQRKLSQLAGVPQAHISKIENGNVDLRISSLIQLSRALGLELALVPRKTLSAVDSLTRSIERTSKNLQVNTSAMQKNLKRMENTITSLVREHPANKQLAQFQRQLKELQRLRVPDSYLETIRKADKSLRAILKHEKSLETVGKGLFELQQLRNSLVHKLDRSTQSEVVKPAYGLDENDND